MNYKEKKMLFQKYQNNLMLHPETCGNNSSHKKLKLCVSDNCLYCVDCNYIQELEVDYFDKLKKLLGVIL